MKGKKMKLEDESLTYKLENQFLSNQQLICYHISLPSRSLSFRPFHYPFENLVKAMYPLSRKLYAYIHEIFSRDYFHDL